MTGTRKDGGWRRGTSYDVAKLAGVSQSAVSRAFGRKQLVAPETRARIMRAAEELGYRPNAIAQGLITRRSMMVAVVIASLTNQIYPEVLSALTRRLARQGMRVLLFTVDDDDQIDDVIDQIGRFQVDGAIVNALLTREQALKFERMRIPLVLYNRQIDDAPVSSVMCESASGEAVLVDGLIAAGARRFGIIAGRADSTVGTARVNDALARLKAAGVKDGDIAIDRGDFSYESGRDAGIRLLTTARPDAIVAANDVMALGAMDAARIDLGLAIPDQLSVVGFDGVAPARWASYALTTIRQPVHRMTDAAVSMLIERIASPETIETERRLLSGELVAGRSALLG
jgi:DNA-binding LacI/PurR family transcriptional regulator